MIDATAATTTDNPTPVINILQAISESTLEVPAFTTLPSFTVTVSATSDPNNPWEISGVAPITLPFGSREVGTGTIYGMRFVLDAPPEVTSAIFDTPAVTFSTADAPAFNIAPFGTGAATIIWANTVPLETAQTFNYTLHAIIDGHHVSHDPTVENLPPSTP